MFSVILDSRFSKKGVIGMLDRVEDISKELFVMVPSGCGSARATRALFRSHRLKVDEYPGEGGRKGVYKRRA